MSIICEQCGHTEEFHSGVGCYKLVDPVKGLKCGCFVKSTDFHNSNRSDHHQWYVVGSHESEIREPFGWADLKLECIADHDCGLTACVMINNINPSMIKIDEVEG